MAPLTRTSKRSPDGSGCQTARLPHDNTGIMVKVWAQWPLGENEIRDGRARQQNIQLLFLGIPPGRLGPSATLAATQKPRRPHADHPDRMSKGVGMGKSVARQSA